MKPFLIVGGILLLGVAAVAYLLMPKQTTPLDSKAENLYAFKVNRLDGKEESLEKYKGKVVLVVNTASKCGLTPQYEALEKIYQANKDKDFVVLGFPANEFANQEPGSNEEIAEFCQANYGVTFPMFEKIVVKGENTHPLYRWLLASTDNKNDIEWNFAKFLIGKDGKVIARFAPRTTPDSPEISQALQKALTN